MTNLKSSLPGNASPWLRAALKSALRRNPSEALADATVLAGILRKLCRVTEAAQQATGKPLPAELREPIWKHIGDVVWFGPNVDRAYLTALGKIHGWKVSVGRDRKTGELRVMAMARLSAKPEQEALSSDGGPVL